MSETTSITQYWMQIHDQEKPLVYLAYIVVWISFGYDYWQTGELLSMTDIGAILVVMSTVLFAVAAVRTWRNDG